VSSTLTEQTVVSVAPRRDAGVWTGPHHVDRAVSPPQSDADGRPADAARIAAVRRDRLVHVDVERARPLSARALQPPGGTLPFGSDKQGRDLFAVMVAGRR